MTKQMNNEHIRVAAYYLWQKAGCPSGMENDFWFQAEHQLYGSNFNSHKSQKSLSKSSSTKLASKKVTLKPAVKSALKPSIVAKPFYGNKK